MALYAAGKWTESHWNPAKHCYAIRGGRVALGYSDSDGVDAQTLDAPPLAMSLRPGITMALQTDPVPAEGLRQILSDLGMSIGLGGL